MILAADVAYSGSRAAAAGTAFEKWDSPKLYDELLVEQDNVLDYIPGKFYLRELPCLLKLLDAIKFDIECMVIDGYVTLGASQKPGLGMYLWESVARKMPVIGVAKSEFVGTPADCKLYRGKSARPLFVTSAGVSLDDAKCFIKQMKGEHRVPDFLKRADQLCRDQIRTY